MTKIKYPIKVVVESAKARVTVEVTKNSMRDGTLDKFIKWITREYRGKK